MPILPPEGYLANAPEGKVCVRCKQPRDTLIGKLCQKCKAKGKYERPNPRPRKFTKAKANPGESYADYLKRKYPPRGGDTSG